MYLHKCQIFKTILTSDTTSVLLLNIVSHEFLKNNGRNNWGQDNISEEKLLLTNMRRLNDLPETWEAVPQSLSMAPQ